MYQHIWWDKRRGGILYRHLRQRPKYRKRYGPYEKRGRVAGKRHISERPAAAERRREIGHWEMDTVVGKGGKHCIVSFVERVTGCVLIGKLRRRTVAALNHRLLQLISDCPHLFKTITADNGTEFHGYRQIEQITGIPIYFATPYHSWERGTNENTNGLIRTVRSEERLDEDAHTGPVQRDRLPAQQSAEKTTSLSLTARGAQSTPLPIIITQRRCRSSKLNLGPP
jgi:IS30 family transposase